MTGARLALHRCASSEHITDDVAEVGNLDRVELGQKRRSFEEAGPLAKRGAIEQDVENIGWQLYRSHFAPSPSIWAEITEAADSENSPSYEKSMLGPAMYDHRIREREVPNMHAVRGENPSGSRNDPSRRRDDEVEERSPPSTSDRPETKVSADLGKVHAALTFDRARKFRSSLRGDVVPPESWQHEKNLRDLVDWEPVEEALRPEGLMAARAALMNSSRRRGQIVV